MHPAPGGEFEPHFGSSVSSFDPDPFDDVDAPPSSESFTHLPAVQQEEVVQKIKKNLPKFSRVQNGSWKVETWCNKVNELCSKYCGDPLIIEVVANQLKDLPEFKDDSSLLNSSTVSSLLSYVISKWNNQPKQRKILAMVTIFSELVEIKTDDSSRLYDRFYYPGSQSPVNSYSKPYVRVKPDVVTLARKLDERNPETVRDFSHDSQCVIRAMCQALKRMDSINERNQQFITFGLTHCGTVGSGKRSKAFWLLFCVNDSSIQRYRDVEIEKGRYYICFLIEGNKEEMTEKEAIGPPVVQKEACPQIELHPTTEQDEGQDQDQDSPFHVKPENILLEAEPSPFPDENPICYILETWSDICHDANYGMTDSLPKIVFFPVFLRRFPCFSDPSDFPKLIRILVNERDEVPRNAFIGFCAICSLNGVINVPNMKSFIMALSSTKMFASISHEMSEKLLLADPPPVSMASPQSLSSAVIGCDSEPERQRLQWLVRFSLSLTEPGRMFLSYRVGNGSEVHHFPLEVNFQSYKSQFSFRAILDDRQDVSLKSTAGHHPLLIVNEYPAAKRDRGTSAFDIRLLVKELFEGYEVEPCKEMANLERLTSLSGEDIKKWKRLAEAEPK